MADTPGPQPARPARVRTRILPQAFCPSVLIVLALAFFAYRHGLPLRMRSSLYPLLGEHVHGPIGHAVQADSPVALYRFLEHLPLTALTSSQAATIAAALPFTFVMIVMCWGMLKAMRMEVVKRQVMSEARAGASNTDWRVRLHALVHQPDLREVQRFRRDKVTPALREVADELRTNGLIARVDQDIDGRVWIEVGQGHDLMGWRKADLIDDVLDQYRRHLHFLAAVR